MEKLMVISHLLSVKDCSETNYLLMKCFQKNYHKIKLKLLSLLWTKKILKTKTSSNRLIQTHWQIIVVARNFNWEGPKIESFCDDILVTFLSDVVVMMSLKWRHNSVAQERFFKRAGGSKYLTLVSFWQKITKHLHQPKMFNGSMLLAHFLVIEYQWGLWGRRPQPLEARVLEDPPEHGDFGDLLYYQNNAFLTCFRWNSV